MPIAQKILIRLLLHVKKRNIVATGVAVLNKKN